MYSFKGTKLIAASQRGKLLTAAALLAVSLLWPSGVNAALQIITMDNGSTAGLAGCQAVMGSLSPQTLSCSNASFSNISISVQGSPTVVSPDLGTITISASASPLAEAHTLSLQVIQTLTGFGGGTGSTTFTYSGLIGTPGPVTYTQFFNGATLQTTSLGPSATPLTFGPATNVLAPIAGAFTDAQSISAVFPASASSQQLEADAEFQVMGTAPPSLSDSQEPGSVIVFPKFINMPAVVVDGNVVPRTEIEIGAICPPLNLFARNLIGCAEHAPVKVRFHWVCPGVENVNSNICRETDFDVNLSVNGKLAFSADGTQINSNSPVVPAAPCPRGYLIGWVIRASDDAPIKFDGLIGNAVIRGPDLAAGPHAGSSTAVSAYNAITIQADPALATGAVLGSANSSSPIVFDGAAGHYQAITGVQVGDVRFDKTAAGAPLPNVLSETFLTFLTLDVRSNQPNNPTFVNLDFWNESDALPSTTNPNFERLLSSFWEFVCWDQVQLSTIDPNLTQAFMGTRKGIVIAGPAVKIENGAPNDGTGPVTLIGLVETIEGTAANGFQERKYNFNMQDDSFPVNTTFVP